MFSVDALPSGKTSSTPELGFGGGGVDSSADTSFWGFCFKKLGGNKMSIVLVFTSLSSSFSSTSVGIGVVDL